MYGKLEKLIDRLLAKLHPLNLMNIIFYLISLRLDSQFKLRKIRFSKKLFAIGRNTYFILDSSSLFPYSTQSTHHMINCLSRRLSFATDNIEVSSFRKDVPALHEPVSL